MQQKPTTSRRRFIAATALAASWPFLSHAATPTTPKKLVLIAGKPSHPPGMHEFNAGCLLLQKCLAGIPGLEVSVHPNHWVSDESVLETADAVVIYADGGNGHPVLAAPGRKEKIQKLVDRGGSVMMMHYAVQCADLDKDQGAPATSSATGSAAPTRTDFPATRSGTPTTKNTRTTRSAVA